MSRRSVRIYGPVTGSAADATIAGVTDSVLHVGIWDVDGNRVVVDPHTGGLVTMDEIHYMIHKGVFYSTFFYQPSFAAGGTFDIMVQTTEVVHFRFSAAVTATALVEFYENTTFSAAGTSDVISLNRNRFSSNVCGCTWTSAPTITDVGDKLGWSMIPAGSKNTAAGSLESSFHEWILPTGTYLIRFTEISGASQPEKFSFSGEYYVPSQIV